MASLSLSEHLVALRSSLLGLCARGHFEVLDDLDHDPVGLYNVYIHIIHIHILYIYIHNIHITHII